MNEKELIICWINTKLNEIIKLILRGQLITRWNAEYQGKETWMIVVLSMVQQK